MANTNFWLLKAVTNLHVGSGDTDYGIVDKHVQRDPVTGLPVLNASSIKGAFREAFTAALNPGQVTDIFGSENRGGRGDDLKQGKYRFYSAKLLGLPVRASADFYYVATCPELLTDFLRDAELFGAALPEELKNSIQDLNKQKPEPRRPHRFGGSAGEVRLEDWKSVRQTGDSGLVDMLGPRIAVLHANDFKQLSDELPVIARNHLENGISTNLWYEQIVPREARFYCPIYSPDQVLEQTFRNTMRNMLQIGGNATVGYGLTQFLKLS